ncbi:MAG: ribosome-associated translation inhibitor RaiA [Gammaproteobacteria bacterium]|nr:ribosome-associated translation inhibitor RaiA [Gammaproteobacteria bacterium]MDJ0870712.1 ribosome-associated translation inhibitor RaiA [Gammaproteobacteria bacterium]MDJ0890237.1 ribosome-associated translation inhibitor RaiA [Gammaproteobacteria bacterium]
MQINLSGHHIEVSPALRDYVTSKLQRLERHIDNVTNAHVVLSIEKLQQKAEATVHISGAAVFADAVHEDMYAAIDALTDKLDRQIKRHKEKRTQHHRSNGGSKRQEL